MLTITLNVAAWLCLIGGLFVLGLVIGYKISTLAKLSCPHELCPKLKCPHELCQHFQQKCNVCCRQIRFDMFRDKTHSV